MDQNLFKHPVNFFSELHHQISLDFKPINPEDELIASQLANMLVLGKGGTFLQKQADRETGPLIDVL